MPTHIRRGKWDQNAHIERFTQSRPGAEVLNAQHFQSMAELHVLATRGSTVNGARLHASPSDQFKHGFRV